MTANYVYDAQRADGGSYGVIWNGRVSEVAANRPGRVCAEVIFAFDGDRGGLGCAIVYALYQAGSMLKGKELAAFADNTAGTIIRKGPRQAHCDWIFQENIRGEKA